MVNLLTIRTHYPQWASRSGISRYLHYLDKNQFRISELLVPMGDHRFPIQSPRIKECVKARFRRAHNSIYDLNDLRAELSAYGRIWSDSIDIVQFCDSEHSLQYLPSWNKALTLFRRKRPVVVGMFHQPKSVLSKIISPKLVRDIDHVILMANEQKEFFLNELPAEKISVILHGIDTDYYKPDPSRREQGVFKCVTVGHWLRDYEVLSTVAEELVGNRDVEFHIVSNENLNKNLGNVIYHRKISDDDLLALYQGAHLLFMPFLDATANNGVLEGIACGLPVLTTDLPATREYLAGADAIFVQKNDSQAFVQSIRVLAERARSGVALSGNSRARALELSWDNVSRRYASLYRTLMHSRYGSQGFSNS